MTTTDAPIIRRYAVLDRNGDHLCTIRGEGAMLRALARSEIAPTDDPKVYRLVGADSMAWRELTPIERRALVLAKERRGNGRR